jgi:hypothetical protein
MSEAIDSVSELERQELEADIRLRERELDIKVAEQVSLAVDRESQVRLRRRELAARVVELRQSRWTSPLVLAILPATVAGVSNILVALYNGYAGRNLEETKHYAQLTLEDAKAEAARILEMIKTGEPDKAAVNLQFLLDTGLSANLKTRESLKEYLAKRAPGQGPSLPPPGSPSSYIGEVVGSGMPTEFCGSASGNPSTSSWHRGIQVKGNTLIQPGTLIATFDPDGTYGNHTDGRSHCAIYQSQTTEGILVLDQWPKHPVSARFIKFLGASGLAVNDGDQYFVVNAR